MKWNANPLPAVCIITVLAIIWDYNTQNILNRQKQGVLTEKKLLSQIISPTPISYTALILKQAPEFISKETRKIVSYV